MAMTSATLSPSSESPTAAPFRTRLTQAALLLNALLHGTASVGMALGLLPHSAAEPHMGRQAGAAGLAGSFMLAFVGRRLRRDPWLILMPLVFVACNLATTIYDVIATRDGVVAPAIPEATFLLIYSVFVAGLWRRRG
jgi:hypothetical protein